MNAEWIVRLILFSLVHWLLAGILLPDLASREKVFGNHKLPWAVVILVIPSFGSLLYLLFHPQVFRLDSSEPPGGGRK